MLVSTLNDFSRQKTPQEIVREAAGTKPVDDKGTPSKREIDRLSREFISGVLEARKKHDADAALVAPALATMYTVRSFDSRQHMDAVTAAVKEILRVDNEMADKIQRWPQETKARVDASSLNQSDKEDFMRGFQEVYGNSEILTLRRDLQLTEEQWAAASIDLYTFASQHATGIKTNEKEILIADSTLLSQFNAKFKNSRDLQKKLDEGNQRLTAMQAATMKKLGISNSDLGLKGK
jgi:hypothetical protein